MVSKMNAYWNTEEAREKSATTSGARMSERKGLGPHIYLSGHKSYLHIQQEMEEELRRPLSLGEVFIKTHTKADGTFLNRKAQSVAERYQKNLEARMSELRTLDDDNLEELTVEEENDLFSGVPYGIGNLSQSHVNGKRTYSGSSSIYQTLQEQLDAAHRKIEEQAAANTRRDAELTKVSEVQQAKVKKLSLVKKYLAKTDPQFLDFLAANKTSDFPNDGPMTAAPENAAPASFSNPTTQPSAA
ncbi:uncharacterized protein LOC112084656 [Eutrema salsugineum]|uniref:uncharacterized protein LOC112084656 n=1 Tax=Eutrema salsugineum TaxID=72664 RepID=UPI000CED1AEA|nr:uncharacterized protein LOC112084656 [Eutrema salsugineum]